MFKPLTIFIGLRYTRAKRRNSFISVISLISMLGVALGVTALITVLSVMNGFDKELRERIVGMTAHITVYERGGILHDWRELAKQLEKDPIILGSAPFVRGQGMLTHAGSVHGVLVQGILPEIESKVSIVVKHVVQGKLSTLVPGEFNIAIGAALAQALQVGIGDKIVLVSTQSNPIPAGIILRLKQFTVTAIFKIGMHDYDAGVALVHMDDAQRMFRVAGGVTGLRLVTNDAFDAPHLSYQIAQKLPNIYALVDWTQTNVNFFRALKTEKIVMFVILTMIIAVAAFNIVSTLIMAVTDKQADIAILRTLGLTPRDIMVIFIVQGMVIGLIGTALGVIGGVWLASNVDTIVPAIERLFQTKFLSPDIYYITELPSDMRWRDVWVISAVAFILTSLATLYPAWIAGRTQPAQALRYE